MDVVDRSFHEEHRQITSGIEKSRTFNSPYKPKGQCHWCEEQVPHPKLYCDHGCAKDHAEHHKRQGRVI